MAYINKQWRFSSVSHFKIWDIEKILYELLWKFWLHANKHKVFIWKSLWWTIWRKVWTYDYYHVLLSPVVYLFFLIRFRCMQISFLSMQFFDCSIHNKCEKYCFSLFCSDVTQATTQTGEELWQMCEYFIINVLVLNFGFRWLFIHPYGICVISLNSQKEM